MKEKNTKEKPRSRNNNNRKMSLWTKLKCDNPEYDNPQCDDPECDDPECDVMAGQRDATTPYCLTQYVVPQLVNSNVLVFFSAGGDQPSIYTPTTTRRVQETRHHVPPPVWERRGGGTDGRTYVRILVLGTHV